MGIEVRERITKEQYERRRRNAGMIDRVDQANAGAARDRDRRQSDLVQETVSRYRSALQAELDGSAVRNEKGLLEDMKRFARREEIGQQD
jgi:hypothetical protein